MFLSKRRAMMKNPIKPGFPASRPEPSKPGNRCPLRQIFPALQPNLAVPAAAIGQPYWLVGIQPELADQTPSRRNEVNLLGPAI